MTEPAYKPNDIRVVRSRGEGIASAADSLNRQIVRLLQADGRMPFSEIAQTLGVSEGTIRNRVNGMKQSGELRIVALADPRAVEYRTDAIIGLKVASSATPETVAERLAALPEVVYVLWVSGRFDLLIEVVGDERDELPAFLGRHIHGHEDIVDSETMTGMKKFKNQFLLKQTFE